MVVTEFQTVEVPVPVRAEIPSRLVDPLPYPTRLGDEITVQDLVEQVFDLYDLVDRCNDDRASVKRLGEG